MEHGLVHRVVTQLVDDERLEGKGYIVFTDNFYTSQSVFQDLAEKGFGACGTAQRDRRGIPLSIRNMKLTRRQVRSSRDDGVLALKWRDNGDAQMLSTCHNSSMVVKSRSRAAEGGVEDIEKPVVVEDYDQHIGGVDLSEFCVF